jgi:hypothetical protein
MRFIVSQKDLPTLQQGQHDMNILVVGNVIILGYAKSMLKGLFLRALVVSSKTCCNAVDGWETLGRLK